MARRVRLREMEIVIGVVRYQTIKSRREFCDAVLSDLEIFRFFSVNSCYKKFSVSYFLNE